MMMMMMIECLKVLLDPDLTNNIDWNMKDENGDSIIMWTIKNDQVERFEVLIECPAIDINAKDNDGNNLVMVAIQSDNLEAFRVLADSPQIDLDDTNKDGDSPLTLALR